MMNPNNYWNQVLFVFLYMHQLFIFLTLVVGVWVNTEAVLSGEEDFDEGIRHDFLFF